MRRPLVKASAVLLFLVLLITVSWTIKPFTFFDGITGDAIEYIAPVEPVFEEDVRVYTDHDLYEEFQDAENEVLETEAVEPEEHDFGFDDVVVTLFAPDIIRLRGTLMTGVTVENIKPGIEGQITWYLDDNIIFEEPVFTGTGLLFMSHSFEDFEYNRLMEEAVDLKATVQFIMDDGEVLDFTVQETVDLENHNRIHWMELEADRVLDLVSSVYNGDFTLDWALENDYDEFDKEVFVSMMGYESETDYLLWVNRSHQRVNVFKGSVGDWELIETFIVSTGRPGRGTKRGVTFIPSRTTAGWHFGTHLVRPVVRFWPGLNYAFHSRLLLPGRSEEFRDARIGFPVSDGCVRMYCDDIWYIYENIPDRTTVVVH